MINSPRTYRIAAGMSLLEVMMALSVLSVGVLVSVTSFATLNSSRRMSHDIVVATALANAIADRFQGVRYDVIGSTTSAPWSLERTEPGTGVAAPRAPLVDDSNSDSFRIFGGTVADRGMQTLGIYPTSTGIDNLCIYIEYYRATMSLKDDGTTDATKPGIMSGEDAGSTYNTATAFEERFRFGSRLENIPPAAVAAVIANRNAYRVDPTSASDTDTFAMRILVTWGQNQQVSILTARGQ